MPRQGIMTQEDVDLQVSYHDQRWDACRVCRCEGDLRYGMCWPCAMGGLWTRLLHRVAVRLHLDRPH